MDIASSNLALRRFQGLAYDKSKNRLWPKIENILPFMAIMPNGQKTPIPLIQNTQSNRYLSYLPQKAQTKMPLPSHTKPPIKTSPTEAPPPTAKTPSIVFDQNKNLKGEIRALTNALSQSRQKDQKFHDESSRLQKQTRSLQQNLKTALEQQAQQGALLKEKTQRLEKLKNNLQQTKNAVGQLKVSLENKQQELSKLSSVSTNEHTQITVLQNEKKAAEAMIKNLTLTLNNLKSQKSLTTDELRKLQKRLLEKENELQEKATLLQKMRGKLTDETRLQNEIKDLEKQISTLSTNKDTLQKAYQSEKNELDSLRKKVSLLSQKSQNQQETIRSQEKAIQGLTNEKVKLSTFIDELAQKLAAAQNQKKIEDIIKHELPISEQKNTKPQPKPVVIKKVAMPASQKKLPQLTTLPNAINGVVFDQQGNFLQSAVVIIRASNNNQPLRAMQTNELGQFVVTTPMSNGKYQIEVDKNNFKFDILEIELKGQVLLPLEIHAHD